MTVSVKGLKSLYVPTFLRTYYSVQYVKLNLSVCFYIKNVHTFIIHMN